MCWGGGGRGSSESKVLKGVQEARRFGGERGGGEVAKLWAARASPKEGTGSGAVDGA